MRLCIFASIFELLPFVHSSERAFLLKGAITSERKQLAYICQERPAARACHYTYSGNSGSRRALRLAVVVEAEAVERTKLQRIEGAGRASCRITIWAARGGPASPP